MEVCLKVTTFFALRGFAFFEAGGGLINGPSP